MKKIYHNIRHCKKCDSIDLKFISKGGQYIGDFGDLYKCENCGQVNDDFRMQNKEYTKYEYLRKAESIKTQIDKLTDEYNFYIKLSLPDISKKRSNQNEMF